MSTKEGGSTVSSNKADAVKRIPRKKKKLASKSGSRGGNSGGKAGSAGGASG